MWCGLACGAAGGGWLAYLLFAWADRDPTPVWEPWTDADPGDETDFDWDRVFAPLLTHRDRD